MAIDFVWSIFSDISRWFQVMCFLSFILFLLLHIFLYISMTKLTCLASWFTLFHHSVLSLFSQFISSLKILIFLSPTNLLFIEHSFHPNGFQSFHDFLQVFPLLPWFNSLGIILMPIATEFPSQLDICFYCKWVRLFPCHQHTLNDAATATERRPLFYPVQRFNLKEIMKNIP